MSILAKRPDCLNALDENKVCHLGCFVNPELTAKVGGIKELYRAFHPYMFDTER